MTAAILVATQHVAARFPAGLVSVVAAALALFAAATIIDAAPSVACLSDSW